MAQRLNATHLLIIILWGVVAVISGVTIIWRVQLPMVRLDALSKLSTTEISLMGDGGSINSNWLVDARELLVEDSEAGRLLSNNSLSLENAKATWQTYWSEPIAVRLPFKMLIKINEQDKDSSIVISGKDSMHTKEWWEDIVRLNISYSNKRDLAQLAVYDGNSRKAKLVFAVSQSAEESLIIVIGQQSISDLTIYSSKGSLLYKTNLARKTQLQLPFGLLPDKMVRIGVLLAPKGRVEIQRLLFYAKPYQI